MRGQIMSYNNVLAQNMQVQGVLSCLWRFVELNVSCKDGYMYLLGLGLRKKEIDFFELE